MTGFACSHGRALFSDIDFTVSFCVLCATHDMSLPGGLAAIDSNRCLAHFLLGCCQSSILCSRLLVVRNVTEVPWYWYFNMDVDAAVQSVSTRKCSYSKNGHPAWGKYCFTSALSWISYESDNHLAINHMLWRGCSHCHQFDNVVVVLRLTCLIVVLALLIFALGIASSIVFRFLVCYFGILDPCCFVACSCGLYVFCRSQFLGCQSFILHSNKDLTSVGVAQSGHICCQIYKNKDTSDWLAFCTSVLLRASFCVCPDCHQGNTVVTLKWTKIHLNHSHFARR